MTKWKLLALLLIANFSAEAKLIPGSDLFTSHTYNSFKINPSGKYLAGQIFLDGANRIIATKSESPKAIEIFELQLNTGGYITGYDWVDDDTLYVNYTFKNGNSQVRIIDFSFNEVDFEISEFTFLTKGFVVNPMSDVENEVLYASPNLDFTGYDLYRLNVHKLKGLSSLEQRKYLKTLPSLNGESFNHIDWFGIGANYKLSLFREVDDGDTRFYVIDSDGVGWKNIYTALKPDKEEVSASKDRLKTFYPIGVFDSERVVTISNIDIDRSAVRIYNHVTKKFEQTLYESDFYDIIWANLDEESKLLTAVYYVERGISKQKLLNSSDQALVEQLKQKISADSIFVVDESLDKKRLIVTSVSSSRSPLYHFYDVETKKLVFLQDAIPALHKISFSKGELLSAKNKNNHLVEAYLSLPITPMSERSPLVVMPHGGPLGIRDFNEFDPEVQYLTNRGYAVLKVNFRGSSGYGKSYVEAGRAELGRGIEEDINLLVDLALKDVRLAADKVCIYGQSYGGYSALISAILRQDRYRCAASAFGVTDLPLLFHTSNAQQHKAFSDAVAWVVGDIDQDHARMLEYSPAYLADKVNVPLLLMAGIHDETASVEHSLRMKYMLKHFGKTVEYIGYQTGHGHRSWLGDRHQYYSLVDFFDRSLGIQRTLTAADKAIVAEEKFLIGEMFRSGDYVEKDLKQAEKYLKEAFHLGHEQAAKMLRTMGVYDFQ